MNRAHNLPIDEMIQVLQTLKMHGVKYVDATVYSLFDIGFRPSEQPPDTALKPPLKNIRLLDITP